MSRIASVTVTAALVASLVACGGSNGDDGLVFGESIAPCAPTVLSNDVDDQTKARDGSSCLLAAVETGEPVTWDVLRVTVEGDPMPIRYAYDGEFVVITDDSTRDEFGAGVVSVRRCAGVAPTDWLPEGRDCVGTNGPGFDDASLP